MPDKTKWFRTDDFQICRQLKKNIYEFVEFNGADDLMISSSDIVDLSNYRDADTGEWNKEAQNIFSVLITPVYRICVKVLEMMKIRL